ncbi:MAG TPA: hypothetical protein VK604_17675 [Bryobacteraceae bacterium]|nr:hypothetical protein [Bryobacteraceae bacterium]
MLELGTPTDAIAFGIDLDLKPKLTYTAFPGEHNVRAAISPDCSFSC